MLHQLGMVPLGIVATMRDALIAIAGPAARYRRCGLKPSWRARFPGCPNPGRDRHPVRRDHRLQAAYPGDGLSDDRHPAQAFPPRRTGIPGSVSGTSIKSEPTAEFVAIAAPDGPTWPFNFSPRRGASTSSCMVEPGMAGGVT